MSQAILQVPKIRCLLLRLTLAALIFSVTICEAHHERVHEEIAKAAVLSSEGLTRYANEILGSTTTPLLFQPFEFSVPDPQPPIIWVSKGAYNQDYWPRWGNHFYTVRPGREIGKVKGLTDGEESLGILPKSTTNSFAWATVPDQPTPTTALFSRNPMKLFIPPPPPAKNEDNWNYAREYQRDALTSAFKTVREGKMARMFYSLGHIIHLNQDLSQPDHTRDDAHAQFWRAHIENHGDGYENHPEWFAPQPRGWAYWRDQAGFKKLLDFWDRDFYTGNPAAMAAALNADATDVPESKLGLAEYSNGNFLGEDALYAEFFDADDTHYFALPSLSHTDQPQLKTTGLAAFLDVTTLADGTQGQRPYLKKMGAGKTVEKHSALKYLAAQNLGKMGTFPARVAVSLSAPEVLQEYHSILIPKAIEYSAGILDYFFRGKLEVCPAYSGTPGQYGLTIKNKSGEDFKDGTFQLFYDDTEGFRTEISSPAFTTTYTGSLAHNEAITAEFTAPSVAVAGYILVFKGTIGTSDGTANDLVDKDIAVAAKRFTWIGGPGESVPPEASAWVAALTKSSPSVSAVYSYQICGIIADFCAGGGAKYATLTYYDLVPSQPNLLLTPTSPYSGPTFWLLIDWGEGSISQWKEITNGFNSVITYAVPVLGQVAGYVINPVCDDASCNTGPVPPIGDYLLSLAINPCNP